LVPFSRLAGEHLAALPTLSYDTSDTVVRRSSRDCLISYDGNFYSVPAAYVGQDLVVKVSETGGVSIWTAQGQALAQHALASGHHERVVCAAHYAGLPAKPPTRRGQAIQQEPERPVILPPAPVVEQRPLAVYEQVLAVGA
jgi:hypothetical protein